MVYTPDEKPEILPIIEKVLAERDMVFPYTPLNVAQLEVDGITYTVSKNGDLVDDKGNIFKEAKDVKEWLKSVEVSDENESNTLSLSERDLESGSLILLDQNFEINAPAVILFAK